MAQQNGSSPGAGSGNTYIDALLWGAAWSGDPINVAFGSGPIMGTDIGFDWTVRETNAFSRAFAAYEAICNIDFQITPAASADIILWNVDQATMGNGALGWFQIPAGGDGPINGYFNRDAASWSELGNGGYGYYTILHELGHGLGLAHPHDGGSEGDATVFPGVSSTGDTGTYGLNQGIWTVMSYIPDWRTAEPSTSAGYGKAATPMAFDIAALQHIYGANMSWHTGNNSHALPTANARGTGWSCIWDAGGTDTITAANAGSGSIIDLRMAPLTGANAGGYVSWTPGIQGGFTIAKGAVIENATGSAFNDRITGNAAANRLDGGGGADTLTGGLGNDIYVTDGGDTIIENAAGGTDTVLSAVSYNLGGGNIEKLTLTGTAAITGTGNTLANAIIGNAAANVINGMGASDRLTGAAGNDAFVFSTAPGPANIDRITDFNVAADTIRLLGTVFDRIGAGAVAGSEFIANQSGTAADASDRIIHDTDNGRLYFDRDGTGAANKVLFAIVDPGLTLTHADFLVI